MTKTTAQVCLTVMFIALCVHVMDTHVWSATRYIDRTCSNGSAYVPGTRACTGGSSLVYSNSSDALLALQSGDTLYYRGGTPSNPEFYGGFGSPPSGSGASGRTVISAYPINRTCSGNNPADVRTCVGSTYETVVLQRTGGAVLNLRGAGAVPGPKRDPKWIVIEGLIIDAATSGDNGITITGGGTRPKNAPTCTLDAAGNPASHGLDTTPDHLRFLNIEIRHAPNQGLLGEDHNENIEIIGSWIHDNGSDFNTDHGLYMAGSNNWLYGNLIERNRAYGIHLYAQPEGTPLAPECDPYGVGMVIENNIVRNNRDGIGLMRGNGAITVRNNLVYSNTRIGVHAASSSSSLLNRVYNNTIIGGSTAGLYLDRTTFGWIIKNNIYQKIYTDPDVDDAIITSSNNYSVCSTCAMPDFVNAPAGDYRLRAGDARINAGANLTSEGVTIDFAGNARPAGGAFDIGAYEHDASGPPPQSFEFSLATDLAVDAPLTIAQGANDTITLTVTKLAGTATSVAFSATGLPSGTTAVFAPTACTPTPSTCTSDVTVTVPNTTPEGTFPIVLRGTSGSGAGALIETVTVDLEVTCN